MRYAHTDWDKTNFVMHFKKRLDETEMHKGIL